MQNTIQPSIDVIIPLYNGEAYIAEALASVAAQTRKPRRIIVVDDGSTDRSAQIVQEFASRATTQTPIPIKLVQKQNGGLSSARNAGLAATDADYVAFLDHDDTWEPNKLAMQLETFSRTTLGGHTMLPNAADLGLVYCRYNIIDAAGKAYPDSYIVRLDRRYRGMAFVKVLRANKILSSGSGVLIKRSVFDDVGLFDENLRFGEDWDMWIRILEKYAIDYVDEILVHIRRHENSMTADLKKVFIGELAFYKKWEAWLANRTAKPNHPPASWSDKIAMRVLTVSGAMTLLKEQTTKAFRRKLFRTTFGSPALYLIVFMIKEMFTLFFSAEERRRFRLAFKKR